MFAPILLAVSLLVQAPKPATADDFVGRWNLRITDAEDTFPGAWFKLEKKDGALDAALLWKWGSVGPAKAELDGGTLRLTRERDGKAEVLEARLVDGAIEGQFRAADGKVNHFKGRRAPELATGAPRWGQPVTLFDGKSLQGWKPRDHKAQMGWGVVNGELAVVEPKGNSDLVSEKTFRDMKLHLEFNVDPKSNSGVYLRGRYEVQILDDAAKATSPTGCGALYSRIAPALDATRPPGEWQTFDITFLGRKLSVVLNGKTIVDGAHVDGITGGAINPFEEEPGPLMLQGDHGKVRFRNIVVTPAE